MKKDILDAVNDAGGFSHEEKAQAIMRCADVIDYLYETASRIAFVYIETQPFEKAIALCDHPEELAIKAMQAAMRQVASGGRQPGEQVH